MRIGDVQNVIMRSFEVQAIAQSAAFQSELAKQAGAIRFQEELQRHHTQVQAAAASQNAQDAGVLAPEKEPHDQAPPRQHGRPLRKGQAQGRTQEEGAGPGATTRSRIDLIA